jgi:L-erythro-3,5-diaminohexanoate dehydrogenase
LDAASFRQLHEKHAVDGAAIREEVIAIVDARGKMQNPVTGSGGMLVGVVEEVGPASPLGLEVGQRVATLVSLGLTPLVLEDALTSWAGNTLSKCPAMVSPSFSPSRSRRCFPRTCRPNSP